jgi:hypothetical protein
MDTVSCFCCTRRGDRETTTVSALAKGQAPLPILRCDLIGRCCACYHPERLRRPVSMPLASDSATDRCAGPTTREPAHPNRAADDPWRRIRLPRTEQMERKVIGRNSGALMAASARTSCVRLPQSMSAPGQRPQQSAAVGSSVSVIWTQRGAPSVSCAAAVRVQRQYARAYALPTPLAPPGPDIVSGPT